jgi:hypothetical protein
MFIAVVGLLGLATAWQYWQMHRQRLLLRKIYPLGWQVIMRWRAPIWLRERLDPWQSPGDVVAVYANDTHYDHKHVEWTHGIGPGWTTIAHSPDAGLDVLKELTSLEALALNNLQVTDAGLANLSSLTGLRKLWLDNTQVTDQGIMHLKGLRRLQLLDVSGTQISETGIARLKKALPDLQVVR